MKEEGGRKMEDRGLRMEDGRSRTENRGRRTEDGEQRTAKDGGRWRIEDNRGWRKED